MAMLAKRNQNWLPSIFNDFFDNEWMEKANATEPAINVVEHDGDYTVEVAAPGMTKEDFNIHIDDDGNLVIAMEKKNEKKDEKKGRYLRREFSYSKFQPGNDFTRRCGSHQDFCKSRQRGTSCGIAQVARRKQGGKSYQYRSEIKPH